MGLSFTWGKLSILEPVNSMKPTHKRIETGVSVILTHPHPKKHAFLSFANNHVFFTTPCLSHLNSFYRDRDLRE